MQVLWVLFISIGLIYLFMMLFFTNGWNRMKAFKSFEPRHNHAASIIIPVRNEEENIANLINDLLQQQYPNERYEIIIVNDHSTDKTHEIVFEFLGNIRHIKMIDLNDDETGKKKAIQKGVSNASNEFIITIDGDVRVGEKWLKTLVAFYELHAPDLIIAPVLIKPSRYFPAIFQALEMLALTGVNGGSCEYNMPLMCNGANLAFKKNHYINHFKNNLWASGDDMFFLIALKKVKMKISYLKSKEAVVWVTAKKNFREIISQKQRWVSKYKGYDDFGILFTAFVVLMMNLIIPISFVIGLFSYPVFALFGVLMGLKILADLILIQKAACFFKQSDIIKYLLLGQLLYPFYATLVGIIGNTGNYQWKGRKVR